MASNAEPRPNLARREDVEEHLAEVRAYHDQLLPGQTRTLTRAMMLGLAALLAEDHDYGND